MKKLISLVLALCMVLTIGVVFADTAVNNRTADTSISITKLDEGDTVALYKIIEWDGYWKPVTGYSGLSQDDVDDIVGQNHLTGAKIENNGGWEPYIDQVIISELPTAIDLGESATIGSNKTFSFNVEPGMYYVLVTPKDGTKIYKPMFVSADYDSTNTSTTVAAKYETITIDKHATAQEHDHDVGAEYSTNEKPTDANSYNTVNIGDTVDFVINTKIPKFPASFTSPIFKVSDTLKGLALVTGDGKIKVYAGETLLTEGEQYTLSTTTTTFTVDFKSEYIKRLSVAQAIKVEYQGVVDNTATYEVNVKENTAEVHFSNNPSDTKGANTLRDETRHYTFDINGLINGSYNRPGTDLIKVGIDANGNEITETIELPNEEWAGALQGAKFTLWGEESKTNKIREDLVSDANGQIVITGLDAGTYWLEETEAPAGFIKSNKLAKIEIIPVFEKKTVAAHDELDEDTGITVTVPEYSYAVLTSYTIKIDGDETATYTVDNAGVITNAEDDEISKGSAKGEPKGDVGKIKNPQGVELPSTGGIGTTIFYILGGLLVVGAAVILIARRKAQD